MNPLQTIPKGANTYDIGIRKEKDIVGLWGVLL